MTSSINNESTEAEGLGRSTVSAINISHREDQASEATTVLCFIIGLLCMSGSLYFTKTMLVFEATNPLQALYVASLISFVLAIIF
jgi:hypothetical protein